MRSSTSAALSPVETCLRTAQHLRGGHAFVLEGRQAAGEDGFADQRQRLAEVERGDGGPLAGALLAGGVEDQVDDCFAVFVFVAEDVAGDFDQVGIEFALVPLAEDLVHLLVGQAEALLHHLVGLADHLHVAVLDAVVDHLDEMARAVLADPVAAGLAVVGLGGNLLEDRLHVPARPPASRRA